MVELPITVARQPKLIWSLTALTLESCISDQEGIRFIIFLCNAAM